MKAMKPLAKEVFFLWVENHSFWFLYPFRKSILNDLGEPDKKLGIFDEFVLVLVCLTEGPWEEDSTVH